MIKSPEPKKWELEFYQFPRSVFEKVIENTRSAQFAVLAVLHELWLRDKYHWNPVKLPNTKFLALGILPHGKLRALRELEKLGLVSVEWREKKSPIVTLNWQPINRKPASWNG
jgi:hypothetical protein